MYPSNLSSHSLILSSHPHHILRVSLHLHQSISLLAISQAITHIGRCKSIAYRDCFHTKGTTHRIVHSQSCTWSVHMHITISPLNLDTSVCIACIYNKSMRSLTQRYIYTRLRMNRLKCWSSYVWLQAQEQRASSQADEWVGYDHHPTCWMMVISHSLISLGACSYLLLNTSLSINECVSDWHPTCWMDSQSHSHDDPESKWPVGVDNESDVAPGRAWYRYWIDGWHHAHDVTHQSNIDIKSEHMSAHGWVGGNAYACASSGESEHDGQ